MKEEDIYIALDAESIDILKGSIYCVLVSTWGEAVISGDAVSNKAVIHAAQDAIMRCLFDLGTKYSSVNSSPQE